MSETVVYSQARSLGLIKPSDGEDVRYRLNLFANWLLLHNYTVLNADLGEWRDYLLAQGYKVRSIQAMLSTTRERLRELTRSNDFINQIKMSLWDANNQLSPADLELQVQSILRSMENNADARNSRIKATVVQDKMDGEKLWLNDDGLWQELLARIGGGKPELVALRDTAIIALFLATGIRREELTNLLVDDIYQTFQGKAALVVRAGKGNKQRAVPYGALWDRFVVPYVNPWVDVVPPTGALFQGFWKGWNKLRHNHLDPATINVILQEYKFERGGKTFYATPHALRRTYARMLFQDYGLSTEGIQQNMGHANIKTTQDYIGILNIDFRIPQNQP